MNASNASADLVRIQSDRITALEAEIEGLRSRLADAEMILSDAFLEHDETGVCRPCQAEKDASDFLKASADPVIRAPRDWHNPDDLVTIRELRNQCEMWADACAMVEMNRDQLRAERDALARGLTAEQGRFAAFRVDSGVRSDAIMAERDALRADAERWRYLRTRRWIEIAAGSVDFSIAGSDASAEAQAFRDSEIDAALAARGKDE